MELTDKNSVSSTDDCPMYMDTQSKTMKDGERQNYFHSIGSYCSLDDDDKRALDFYSSDSTDVKSIVPESSERWWMLCLYCCASFINSMLSFSYSPLPDAADAVCGFKGAYVLMVQIYLNAYVITSILASCLVEVFGLGPSVRTACWVQGIGAALRCVRGGSKTVYIVGQALCGVSQGFFINTATEVAMIWFGVDERLVATTIAVNVNTLGISGAYAIILGLIAADEIGGVKIEGKEILMTGLDITAALSLSVALACQLFFLDEPKNSPSKAAEMRCTRMACSPISCMGIQEPLLGGSDRPPIRCQNPPSYIQRFLTSVKDIHDALYQHLTMMFVALCDLMWPMEDRIKIYLPDELSSAIRNAISFSCSQEEDILDSRMTSEDEFMLMTESYAPLSPATDGNTSNRLGLPSLSPSRASSHHRPPRGKPDDAFRPPSRTESGRRTSPFTGSFTGSFDLESYTSVQQRRYKSFRFRPGNQVRQQSRDLTIGAFESLAYDPDDMRLNFVNQCYPHWMPRFSGSKMKRAWTLVKKTRFGYWAVCIAFASSESLVNQFSSDIGDIFNTRGFTPIQSLSFGMFFVIFSLVGSYYAAIGVSHKDMGRAIIGMTLACAVLCFNLYILDSYRDSLNVLVYKILFAASIMATGGLVGPIQGFTVELAAEVAFPFLGENVSGTILQMVGNLSSSIAMGYISPYARQSVFGLYLGALPIFCLIPFLMCDMPLRRLQMEYGAPIFRDGSLIKKEDL